MSKQSKTQKPPQAARSPVALAAQQPQHQTAISTTHLQQYSGQIPPPDMLRGFDQVQPGTAARLIQWAEDEQQHRQQLEREAQAANIQAQERQLSINRRQVDGAFRSDMVGQIFGFLVCMVCVGSATYLASLGQIAVAIALAAIPTGAVIFAFRGQIFGKSRDPK
jgi:uncharacterized membrane protein